MLKRRWSNNGGFALRLLEESSSEVTSSSAGLIMSPVGGITMSPSSLGSPVEYNELNEIELWPYHDPYHNHHHHNNASQGNIISGSSLNGPGVGSTGCMNGLQQQTSGLPLPSMASNISHTPRSESANSISSGN